MLSVGQWMARHVQTVKPHDTVLYARTLLEEHRIRQVPVTVAGKLVGIVTDRDLRDAFPSVFEEGRHDAHVQGEWTDPDKLTVDSIMSAEPLTLTETDPLVLGVEIMVRERIGAIPVVDDHKHLVGIFARTDALLALLAIVKRSNET